MRNFTKKITIIGKDFEILTKLRQTTTQYKECEELDPTLFYVEI